MSDKRPTDLKQQFESAGVRQVECIFPDVTGTPRGKLMPAASFAAGAELRIAQAIAMQAVTGEYSWDSTIFPDEDPDVRMQPDYSTLTPVPWSAEPRMMAIHDCVELGGGLCDFAPRSVLKKVLERYAERGLLAVVAPEIEFYLTALVTDPRDPLVPPRTRGGRAEIGQSAFGLDLLHDQAGYWNELQDAFEVLGVRGDTWIHEMGMSQFEINLVHGDPLNLADQAFLFKLAAKEVALKHGMQAVFMAKPIAGQAGSSMHLHQSVVDSAGRNIFATADGSDSPLLGQYIAGLQHYLPDLMLLFAPFVNSYRRYVKDSQAPTDLQWGLDNRSAGLRIPLSAPVARRIENRLAGADANPYLVIAATLAAGLAGIDEGLVSTAALGKGDTDRSHTLPRSFLDAHGRMLRSDSARRLLGDRFIHAYTAAKEVEFESYLNEIGAWERRFLAAAV